MEKRKGIRKPAQVSRLLNGDRWGQGGRDISVLNCPWRGGGGGGGDIQPKKEEKRNALSLIIELRESEKSDRR